MQKITAPFFGSKNSILGNQLNFTSFKIRARACLRCLMRFVTRTYLDNHRRSSPSFPSKNTVITSRHLFIIRKNCVSVSHSKKLLSRKREVSLKEEPASLGYFDAYQSKAETKCLKKTSPVSGKLGQRL